MLETRYSLGTQFVISVSLLHSSGSYSPVVSRTGPQAVSAHGYLDALVGDSGSGNPEPATIGPISPVPRRSGSTRPENGP